MVLRGRDRCSFQVCDQSGLLAGAIHWAATDCMPQGAIRAANPAAGDTLRDSQRRSFYAKAMAIRYNKSNTSSVVSGEQGRCLAASRRPSQIRPGYKSRSICGHAHRHHGGDDLGVTGQLPTLLLSTSDVLVSSISSCCKARVL
jgi:hypothetical protein